MVEEMSYSAVFFVYLTLDYPTEIGVGVIQIIKIIIVVTAITVRTFPILDSILSGYG